MFAQHSHYHEHIIMMIDLKTFTIPFFNYITSFVIKIIPSFFGRAPCRWWCHFQWYVIKAFGREKRARWGAEWKLMRWKIKRMQNGIDIERVKKWRARVKIETAVPLRILAFCCIFFIVVRSRKKWTITYGIHVVKKLAGFSRSWEVNCHVQKLQMFEIYDLANLFS